MGSLCVSQHLGCWEPILSLRQCGRATVRSKFYISCMITVFWCFVFHMVTHVTLSPFTFHAGDKLPVDDCLARHFYYPLSAFDSAPIRYFQNTRPGSRSGAFVPCYIVIVYFPPLVVHQASASNTLLIDREE